MCGIAGLWRLGENDPADLARIERMTECLRHRGPDDHGYLLAHSRTGQIAHGRSLAADFVPDLVLGSRRLSIIDLSSDGVQPMANEAGDIFVVFNGAIHNYKELRQDLEARGHSFRSQTDTEVIVHGYEEWGAACAKRFNGMWAYAIWDHRERRLVCSRDRFGVKPLYVAQSGGTFYFASELKSILAAGMAADPNRAAIARYIARGHLDPARETLFNGIKPLPAGHTLVITGGHSEQQRFWSYGERSESYDYAHPEQTFETLFADSVRLRLRADVPMGVLLSGGLDSTSVAAYASRESPSLIAFTAVFPGFRGDEHRYARLVADRFAIPFRAVEYRSDGLTDDLAKVIWHLETPPRDPQVLARWVLLQAASHEVKVVLEGQGADELLAGYLQRYIRPYVFDELAGLRPGNAFPRARRLVPALGMVARDKTRAAGGAIRGVLAARGAGATVLSKELSEADALTVREPDLPGPFPDRLTNALWRDHSRAMLPHLLHFGDAISMAHSVESRVPFLDHRLVEFVFGMPYQMKLQGTQTKQILRRSLGARLPPEILHRRTKVGFDTPLSVWLRSGFHNQVRPILDSNITAARRLFDAPSLRRHLNAFESGQRGLDTVVFRSLAIELWARIVIDGDRSPPTSSCGARP